MDLLVRNSKFFKLQRDTHGYREVSAATAAPTVTRPLMEVELGSNQCTEGADCDFFNKRESSTSALLFHVFNKLGSIFVLLQDFL